MSAGLGRFSAGLTCHEDMPANRTLEMNRTVHEESGLGGQGGEALRKWRVRVMQPHVERMRGRVRKVVV